MNERICMFCGHRNIINKVEVEYKVTEIIELDIGNVFPKGAIAKRNRCMVDKSDYMVVYVKSDYGGAYNTMKYALKNNKAITINI